MNKLFTKIAALFLGATMAVGVGVAVGSNSKEATPVHAESQTYTLIPNNATSGSSATAYVTADTSFTYPTTNGVSWHMKQWNPSTLQIKTNQSSVGSEWCFYTGKFPGKITKVEIYFSALTLSSASNTGMYVVGSANAHSSYASTGGTQMSWDATNKKLSASWTTSDGYYAIAFYQNGKKATGTNKLDTEKSIVVTYESGSSDTTTALSVSPNAWAGYDSQTINVSNYNVSCTSTKSPGYEFQGIGSGSDDNFVARVADFTSGRPTKDDTRLQWKAKYPTTAGGSTYLYAYVSLNVTADNVNSIAISGSMTKTTYSQGDAWDPSGFTVNAYYSSAPSTPVNVTSSVSWTYSTTTASTSTTSVTCTASFGGKSDTSSAQSVTITEKSYIGGIVNGGKYVIVADSGYILPSAAEIKSEPKNVASYISSMKNDEDYCWTFTTTGVDNHWTITNSLGTSLKHAASNDGVRTSTTSATSDDFVASLTGDNVTVDSKSYTGIYLVANSRYLTQYTANVSWRCYTSAGTNGTSKLALIPYETPDVLDSDLTLTGKPASLTAGSLFPGVTKAEAEYSETGTVDVTEDVTYTLGGTAIAVGDTVPAAKVGASVTVVVTYTDAKDDSATASFSIPVIYKPVTSVTLDRASATFAKGGTVQLTATVSDEYAIQTVKWTTSDSSIATVSAPTSTSGDVITVKGSSLNAGSATITAYVDENDNGSLDSGEKSATCAITVSGDPVLNMLDDKENIISGESLHAFTTDSNIYLYVDAQNFVGAITYSWSSSNPNAIAIVEEVDEMCEFEIVGAGTNVRLSCHAVGETSGDLTTYVDYTVTEPQVDEVTWSAPATLSVYDNASLTASNITSWSPAYHKDNGESGSISSEYTVKLGGTTISLSHSWDVEEDGEELWIEYGGIASSHVTVQVTEHLNAISYSSWSLVTDVSDLCEGDVVIIANADKGKAMASTALKAGETLETTDVTIVDGEVTSEIPDATARFTLGGNASDGWSFKCGDNYLYFSTTSDTRTMDLKESSSSYNITIDGETGDAIIGGTMRVVLNAGTSPLRWSSYKTTTETNSMQFPEIYKASNSNIADTNVNAQRALISFAKTFNTTMACDDGGDTANVESKWSSVSSAFTTAMNALGTDDKAVFKRLVANASAVEGGDSLQDMLARYDYIIAKYKLSNDFLHDGADRGAVQYARVTPFNIIGNNGNTVAIIVVISMISVTCIGGYFFLRKRKEN